VGGAPAESTAAGEGGYAAGEGHKKQKPKNVALRPPGLSQATPRGWLAAGMLAIATAEPIDQRGAGEEERGSEEEPAEVSKASWTSSNATALMRTPAPKAMIKPRARLPMRSQNASSPPRIKEEPASNPHRNDSAISSADVRHWPAAGA